MSSSDRTLLGSRTGRDREGGVGLTMADTGSTGRPFRMTILDECFDMYGEQDGSVDQQVTIG
jgi:hypothetical protein